MIFIHGLGGDAFGTWCPGKNNSDAWPYWLGEEFPDVGVWSLAYAASPTRWARFKGILSERWRDAGHSMALPDRALQVLDLMLQRGLGDRPLFFICHSLGGLVAKQLLRKSADATDGRRRRVADQTRAVLFLATPHAGAALASLLSAFRAVFGPTVSIEDLRAHDAHLRDLSDWYRNHAAELGIETATYYELRDIRGVSIVNPTSAHPGVGADPVGLDEDHLSIAKPRSHDDQVCGAARELLRNYVLASGRILHVQPPPSPVAPARAAQEIVVKIDATGSAGADIRRIPYELPPAAEQFFGRDAEKKQLTERLRAGRNIAVVGPAGLGKTALAAEAVRAVVGDTSTSLATSPFTDGVAFLDLYTFHGQAEPAWNTLANKLAGAAFMERSPAQDRAAEACRGRRILVIIEGGEEADGKDGRASIKKLLSVLSPENRWLLLTRLSTQATPAESVQLKEALYPSDAANLLDSLTQGRVAAVVRDRLLELLEGHPLALTWAGNLIARDDDDPQRLVGDWHTDHLPRLSDPTQAEHTLEWLFNRSVRGLGDAARLALAAAGLLSREAFPLAAMRAALGDADPADEEATRAALKSLVQSGLLRRSEDADYWQFTHVLGYRFARKETGSDPALRARLSRWLQGHLEAALGAGAGEQWTLAVTRLLEHAAALLRCDDDQRLWIPLGNYLLYKAHDRLLDRGRLPLVTQAATCVAGWLERFPTEKLEDAGWLRERSVLLNYQGDVLGAQGDLAAALAAYREAFGIAQRLAAADPSNARWQHDLGVSHSKVGDVLRSQGDLAGALSAYREMRTAIQRLAAADPSNAEWQRELSVCHNKVGDVLRAQGDRVGALAAYREALGLRQRLVEADPSNAERQRDLSVSHNKVGDLLGAQGDWTGALAVYHEGLGIAQRLVAADPSNARWQRDLGVSHSKVGDVLGAQGDRAGALAAYQEVRTVMQRLAAADLSNAEWRRDLSLALTVIAQLHEDLGDRIAALRFAEESLEIDERLAALDPTNAIWQRDVAVSRALVARLRR